MLQSRVPRVSRTATIFKKSFCQSRTQATSSFQEWRRTSPSHKDNMATPTKIVLTLDTVGIVKNKPQTQEAADKASELLQENHEVALSS
jgi:hypothetical protein